MRLIDADTAIYRMQKYKSVGELTARSAIRIVKELADTEQVDAVEVVRCKDCRWCEDTGMSGLYCINPDNRNPMGCGADEFCNCGERKGAKDARNDIQTD